MHHDDTIASLLERLDRWFHRNRPHFASSLREGASQDALEALQRELRMRIPTELQQLLSWHNGQSTDFVGRFEENWLLMNTEQIRRAKHEIDELVSDDWDFAWLPFLDDDAGNYMCVDSSKKETPVVAYYPGDGRELVAPTFEQWLTDFVAHVENGDYEEDPERGSFMRYC